MRSSVWITEQSERTGMYAPVPRLSVDVDCLEQTAHRGGERRRQRWRQIDVISSPIRSRQPFLQSWPRQDPWRVANKPRSRAVTVKG